MPSPLVHIYDRTAVLAPQYGGSISYYATMAQYADAIVDTGLRHDKRFKSVHRCDIVDTRAPLQLTVPVSRPKDVPCRSWHQVTVSPQAQWWSDHRVSLESAYGRTPYFEFYIDRFLRHINSQAVGRSIVDLDRDIDQEIRRILQLDTQVAYMPVAEAAAEATADYRRNNFPQYREVPYYQVRADKLGFVPGLSIFDLIFNMGPESPLVLQRMIQS